MNQRRMRLLSNYLFLAPYLILFSGFILLPMGFGLILSFTDWELVSLGRPRFIGIANYVEAVTHPLFWKASWATFRFVLLTVPLVTLGALVLALLLNALPRRLEPFFRAAYFLPTLISISVAAILWRWFYNNDYGLFNSLITQWGGGRLPWITDVNWAMKSVVLMTLWWTVGGPMVILLAGLKQVPGQLYEAAAIDGATRRQMFFHVTLPMIRPILLLVIMLNTIGSFQVFGQPLLITNGGPDLSTRVLVLTIYDTAFGAYRMGYSAAMSWLLFLFIAPISYIQYRAMRDK